MMPRHIALPAVAMFCLAASGCAISSDTGGDHAAPPLAAACAPEKAAALAGQAGTADNGGEAMRLTGARSLRWIPPGAAVTMDYRPDRLNVELDGQGIITAFKCG